MYWSGCDRHKDHGLSVGRGCDRRKDHDGVKDTELLYIRDVVQESWVKIKLLVVIYWLLRHCLYQA